MDESALKVLISNLESSRATLDSWLFVFTLFVVVGVVLEVVFVIWEYRDELHEWRRGIVHPPEKPSIALLVFGLFGAGLVAIGVAGELYIGAKIGAKETSIREANDHRASLLSKLAGDAAISAKIAHDEADGVKGIADEARADAKDALAKAQAAQRELAHAEADAVKAQTAASKALSTANQAESQVADAMRRAKELTAELERLTTPRHIFHKAKLSASLKAFSGTEYVFIGTCGDQECFDLVSDINELLEFAGWKRIKGPPMRIGLTQFQIHSDKEFGVDTSVSIGTAISVETPNGLDSVKALPENQLPAHIRAASALAQLLALNISPPENTRGGVNVDKGTSTAVRIDVGRKPL